MFPVPCLVWVGDVTWFVFSGPCPFLGFWFECSVCFLVEAEEEVFDCLECCFFAGV